MQIAVLGDAAGNAVLEQLGFRVRANERPQPGEPLLIAVSVRTGPLGFEEALNRATGCLAEHIGLLLTELGPGLDDELASLVELETRYLLEATGVFPRGIAHRLLCLRTDDIDVRNRLAAWASSSSESIVFGYPELLPDW
jgi:hypothetical protein